jgi:hypothetical protein
MFEKIPAAQAKLGRVLLRFLGHVPLLDSPTIVVARNCEDIVFTQESTRLIDVAKAIRHVAH